MQKVRIIAHADHKEHLIEKLHNLGMIEVESLRDTADRDVFLEDSDTTDVERKIAELKYGIDFLYAYSKKPNLLESFFSPKYGVEKRYYTKIVEKYDLSIIETLRSMDQKITELKNEEKKLKSITEQLLPWERLNIPMEDLETQKTITELGILSQEYLSVISSLDYAHIQVVLSTKRKTWVAITYLKSFNMEEVLRKTDFQKISLPTELEGTPAQNRERIQKDLENIQKERENLEEECTNLAKERFNLMILHDHYQNIKLKHEVRKNFINTRKSFVLEGWVKRKDADAVKKELSLLREVDVSFYEPEETENVPVAMENNRIKPFEVVTKIYGLPHYREIDPTPLLTPFFIVYFALCLSDVVYGTLLVILSLFVLKKVRIGPDAQMLFRVLIMGGLLAIVFGMVTGGWAGDLTAYLPERLSFLDKLRVSLTRMDPLKDPLVMLKLSLLLGLFQVWTGILIKGYLRVRDGQALDALFDQGLWLILLPVGTMTVLNKMFGVSMPYPDVLFKISMGAVIGLVLTQGRYQKASNIVFTVFKKALVGLLSLYSIFGYLGDTLSYSRILALGLATTALASAFNMVAAQFGSAGTVGLVFAIVWLIGAHMIDLIISTLGAFIHSGRLQFVEYFTKFLEGGGRMFKPFGFNSRYIKIMEDD